MSRLADQHTQRRKGPVVEKRELTAIRIPPAQKAEIKARAEKLRLTFTEYMIRAALGELPDSDALAERVDALEKRLELLERYQDLGA